MAGSGDLWIAFFDGDAVLDLEDVKSKGDRKVAFEALRKLRQGGPALSSPHMKSLKGEPDLFELRPKRGASAVRLIYARIGDRYVILAVAPDKARFGRAVVDARSRLSRYRGGR
jgi:hypothetical protein